MNAKEKIIDCFFCNQINANLGIKAADWNAAMLRKLVFFIAHQTDEANTIIDGAWDATYTQLDEIQKLKCKKYAETKVLHELASALYQLKMEYPCSAAYHVNLALEWLYNCKSNPYDDPNIDEEDFLDISDLIAQIVKFVQEISKED